MQQESGTYLFSCVIDGLDNNNIKHTIVCITEHLNN